MDLNNQKIKNHPAPSTVDDKVFVLEIKLIKYAILV